MTGDEVVAHAISVLLDTIHKSNNELLNKVRSVQLNELRVALLTWTPEAPQGSWEASHQSQMVLARAILDDLTPGWNRR